MKSPFPGMDPYLEQHWRDVGHNLITFAQGMINRHLPGDLRARIDKSEDSGEAFIKVIGAALSRKLVTVIEILTLSHKTPGKSQGFYRWRRDEFRRSRVTQVEIDLLRDGAWALTVPEERIPLAHRKSSKACICRGWNPARTAIYFSSLREPLPTIEIPLRESDSPVPLNLQMLIDQCYENGRYDDLDYARDPVPPLDPEDAAWADALLRHQGKR